MTYWRHAHGQHPTPKLIQKVQNRHHPRKKDSHNKGTLLSRIASAMMMGTKSKSVQMGNTEMRKTQGAEVVEKRRVWAEELK